MKTLGIIGGLGPESTIDYYKLLIDSYRERVTDGSYPTFLINNVDLQRMIAWVTAGDYERITEYLTQALEQLARAGAEFGLISANTPHIVFDDLAARTPIPLISIVEATCENAKSGGLRKLGLLGTRFTMQAGFYQKTFARAGVELAVPPPDEITFVHEKYMGELVKGVFRDETRARLLEIAQKMKERDKIEALILGGTELPLILRDASELGIPLLDTTRIHINAALDRMLA